MSALIFHVFNDAHSDGSDATLVNPSNWNDGHKFTGGNNGSIPLRDTSDGTYGSSWLASVAVGQVVVSAGIGALPAWSGSPTLTGIFGVAGSSLIVQSASGQNIALQATGASLIQFTVNGTNWLSVNQVGTFFPVTDNTNQLGSTTNRWTTAYLSTALFMGTNPATAGEIRLPNNGAGIATRNAANSANYTCLFMDNSNVLYLGDPVTPSIVQLNSTITRINGATASFPALKRNAAILAVRLADDSSDAAISAANFQIPTAGTLTATADGVWEFQNSAGTGWGRLMFGGNTASFPALKRDTIFLSLRLADDSGVSGAITASLPAGAAGRDGNIGFDTTLNAFVYYVGGNRYKLVGTAF